MAIFQNRKGFLHNTAHIVCHRLHIGEGLGLTAGVQLHIPKAGGVQLPIKGRKLRLDLGHIVFRLLYGVIPHVIKIIGKFRIVFIAGIRRHLLAHRHQIPENFRQLLTVHGEKLLGIISHRYAFTGNGIILIDQSRFSGQHSVEILIVNAFSLIGRKETGAKIVLALQLLPQRRLGQRPIKSVQARIGNGAVLRAESIFRFPVRIGQILAVVDGSQEIVCVKAFIHGIEIQDHILQLIKIRFRCRIGAALIQHFLKLLHIRPGIGHIREIGQSQSQHLPEPVKVFSDPGAAGKHGHHQAKRHDA